MASSDLLTGNLRKVFPTPSAGPGARNDEEPPTVDPWQRPPMAAGTPPRGTPPVDVETSEGVVKIYNVYGVSDPRTKAETEVIHAIEALPLDDTAPARLPVEAGYEGLAAILDEALAQSQSGKGKERHADGNRFEEQPIFVINKLLGSLDGNAYQIMKKVQEGVRQVREGDAAGGRRNLLGAIVYAAATIGLIDQGVGGPRKG